MQEVLHLILNTAYISTREVGKEESEDQKFKVIHPHTEFKASSLGWYMKSCLNKAKIKYKEDIILKNSALLNKSYYQKNKL